MHSKRILETAKCDNISYYQYYPYFCAVVWRRNLLWLVKEPKDGEARMSGFLGKGKRGERVKVPRKPIYAEGWILTSFRPALKV